MKNKYRNIFGSVYIVAAAAIGISSIALADSADTPNVMTKASCSSYGAIAASCNDCFDGGTSYSGRPRAKYFDVTFNNQKHDDLMSYRETGTKFNLTPLQSSISVGQSSNFNVKYSDETNWFKYDGKDVTIFFADKSILHSQMAGGIIITDVKIGANANIPAYLAESVITTQVYNWDKGKAEGSPVDYHSCVFVKPRWCGDNIVSDGEVCDEGSLNGHGKCNSTCSLSMTVQ